MYKVQGERGRETEREEGRERGGGRERETDLYYSRIKI